MIHHSSDNTLYVGNLNNSVTEQMLITLFQQFGPINGIRVLRKDPRNLYAFVAFGSHEAAAAALDATRASSGQTMVVNWANRWTRAECENHYEVYVGQLSSDVDDKALYAAFLPFGVISRCLVVRSNDKQKTKGYGFVLFVNELDAQNALLTMNGTTLYGQTIQVGWTKNKPVTSQTGASAAGAAVPEGGDDGDTDRSAVQMICTVFCGGVLEGLTVALVEKVFFPFGTIVQTPKIFPDKGYAFIKFRTSDEAKSAIEAINNTLINGYPVTCSWATREEAYPSRKVPVSGRYWIYNNQFLYKYNYGIFQGKYVIPPRFAYRYLNDGYRMGYAPIVMYTNFRHN